MNDPYLIAIDIIGQKVVSTRFLGIGWKDRDNPNPILFETVILPDYLKCWQYYTAEEARIGHKQIMAIVRKHEDRRDAVMRKSMGVV